MGCLLKEAVVSRTLALIAAKRSNLSRGLQEAKAGSPRHLKAPLENWILFSTCRVVRWIWKIPYLYDLCCQVLSHTDPATWALSTAASGMNPSVL